MKRIIVVLVGIIAVAFAASAVASGKAPTVKLRGSALGKILVNGRGRTAYMFTRDRRNRDVCAKINGCSSVWPALTVKGKPIAGPRPQELAAGDDRARRRRQAGHLCRSPAVHVLRGYGTGRTDYVGAPQFRGTWYAVNSAGKTVR